RPVECVHSSGAFLAGLALPSVPCSAHSRVFGRMARVRFFDGPISRHPTEHRGCACTECRTWAAHGHSGHGNRGQGAAGGAQQAERSRQSAAGRAQQAERSRQSAAGRAQQAERSAPQTRLARWASTTAWTRSRRWSLLSTLDTWVFTVASPRYSVEAISALDSPEPTSPTTSR